MSRDFREIDRETPQLFPPAVQDYVPDDHLAQFVVDVVGELDLRCLTDAYAAGGKRPYHPATMLAMIFHGYATGVFPSRKTERATYGSLPFLYIAGGSHPDHDTIAAFRKRFPRS